MPVADEEVVVTDRGLPVACLTSIEHTTDRLAELITAGIVRPPTNVWRHRLPPRIRSLASMRVSVDGSPDVLRIPYC